MSDGPARPRVVAVGGGHGTGRHAAGGAAATPAQVTARGVGGRRRRVERAAARAARRHRPRATCASAWWPWPTRTRPLAAAFEHRFEEGELAGHALGQPGPRRADRRDRRPRGGRRRGGPAARGRGPGAAGHHRAGGAQGRGRRRARSPARWRSWAPRDIQPVSLVPGDARPPPAGASSALAQADQVVIGPGSLFTSVLAAVAVPGIAEAMAARAAQRRLRLQPAPPGARDRRLRRRRPTSRPWPGTGSRSTWCCATRIRGMALGPIGCPGARRPPGRRERPGPRPGQTGGGAVGSAGMSARADERQTGRAR